MQDKIIINKYKGFEFPTDSLRQKNWKLHYTGYDYSKTLIKSSLMCSWQKTASYAKFPSRLQNTVTAFTLSISSF